MKKSLNDVISEAIDFGSLDIDKVVVCTGDDCSDGFVKIDGWVSVDDIKRAYKAIKDYEMELQNDTN